MIACLSCSILTPLTATAATSELSQTINPIRCTYTVFKTGTTTLTPTQCSSQLVPTLSSVTTVLEPRLTGAFAAIQTTGLRVWVGENWFTLGVSSALTVNGDTWTLDLADVPFSLAPSTTYTVIIEATTVNWYLLSSVYEDVLTTQAAVPVANNTQPPTPGNLSGNPISTSAPIDLLAPLSEPGMSHYYYGSSEDSVNYGFDVFKSPGLRLISDWVVLSGIAIFVVSVLVRIVYPAWKGRGKRG